jgi:UDP-N-acetylglucosamine 2-epimerase (non-hydrolysing)/GDP/UDP-N,N'-diacetylbacillosamine 2-epimerase (hydrolysing)
MAHVHFVTNEIAARRVRQMGEDPANIHVVGSPGIDSIRRLKLLTRAETERALGFEFLERNLLVTFHPVTLEQDGGAAQFAELLAALEAQPTRTRLIFTMPNADTGGRGMGQTLQQWASGRAHVHVFTSLGQLRYLSLMSHVQAVVGNSSSGLYEAPSFRVPTVDIGDRQRGRMAARSVVHCQPDRHSIQAALGEALSRDCSGIENPYGDGHSSEQIVATLKAIENPSRLLKKRFHMLGEA